MNITGRQMLVLIAGLTVVVGLFVVVALTIYGFSHGFRFEDKTQTLDFFIVGCGLVGAGGVVLWIDANFGK